MGNGWRFSTILGLCDFWNKFLAKHFMMNTFQSSFFFLLIMNSTHPKERDETLFFILTRRIMTKKNQFIFDKLEKLCVFDINEPIELDNLYTEKKLPFVYHPRIKPTFQFSSWSDDSFRLKSNSRYEKQKFRETATIISWHVKFHTYFSVFSFVPGDSPYSTQFSQQSEWARVELVATSRVIFR